jgi:hypothetical protein
VIYLDNNIKNKISLKLKEILKNKIYFKKIFKTNNINNKNVVKYLINLKHPYIVYSGYSGFIIKDKKLLKKK